MFNCKTSTIIGISIILLLVLYLVIQFSWFDSKDESLIKISNALNTYHYQVSFPLGRSNQVNHLKTYVEMSKQINSISESTRTKRETLYDLIHNTTHNLWDSLNFQTFLIKDIYDKTGLICRKNHNKAKDMKSIIKELGKRYSDNSYHQRKKIKDDTSRLMTTTITTDTVTADQQNQDVLRMVTFGTMPLKMIQKWNQTQVIKSLSCDELLRLNHHKMSQTDVILLGICISSTDDQTGDMTQFPPSYSNVYAFYDQISDVIQQLQRRYPRTPVVWIRPAYDLNAETIMTSSLIQDSLPREANDARQLSLYRDLVALCEYLTIKHIVHDLGVSVLPLPIDGSVFHQQAWDEESSREGGLDWASASMFTEAEVAEEVSTEVTQQLQLNLLQLVCVYTNSNVGGSSRSNLRDKRGIIKIKNEGVSGRVNGAIGDERRALMEKETKKEKRLINRTPRLQDKCTSNLLYSRKYDYHCMPRPRPMQSQKGKVQPHRLHRLYKLLVTGLGGAGTHSLTHALQDLGLDVRHEALGADGSVSWLYAVNDVLLGRPYPFKAGLNLTLKMNMDSTVTTSATFTDNIPVLPQSKSSYSQSPSPSSSEKDKDGFEYMSVWAPRFETVVHLTRHPLSHISTFSGHLLPSFLFIHDSLQRIRYSEMEQEENIIEQSWNISEPRQIGNPLGELVLWGVRNQESTVPLSSCLQPHVIRGSACRLPLAAAAWLHWTLHVHTLADATFAVEKLTSDDEEDKGALQRLMLMLLCHEDDAVAVNLGNSQTSLCSKISKAYEGDSNSKKQKQKKMSSNNKNKMLPADTSNPNQVHHEYSLKEISRVDEELANHIVKLADTLNLKVD